jgi:hypothetical protein
VPLHAAAVVLGAFLLFQVQPILARAILPWFGGSAAVWTGCLLFFQAGLLAGYLYAHLLVRALPPRGQAIAHVALLAASCLALPITPDPAWKPPDPDNPIGRLLALLAATVGLPYLALSATSPLLSAWLARRGEAAPWWLYAVSNAGSLLALLAYPFAVEPLLPTRAQAIVWSAAFVGFVLVCGVVALDAWRAEGGAQLRQRTSEAALRPSGGPPFGGRISAYAQVGGWLLLACCPSVLLLATTSHLTQNVAPVPFLWVVPLALYLLSFVLCFAPGRWYRRWLFLPLAAVAFALAVDALAAARPNQGLGRLLPVFAGGLFVWCMVLHGELSRRRPDPSRLTGYYLALAAGGAAGGALAALLAPVVLPGDFDLPIALVAAAALALAAARPGRGEGPLWALWGVAALVAASLAGQLVAATVAEARQARLLARNFYGSLRVVDRGFGPAATRMLNHGTITHGEQYLDPAERGRPITYYSPASGVGAALRAAAARERLHVGVVGLGAGTLAAYGRRGDRYRFYEINPLVVEIARREFTFLSDTPAEVATVLGDARLSLEREPPQGFDLLAVDAFSSDAIPVHLLTREAFALYAGHLAPGGVLAVHVSNRHLDLVPVVLGAGRAVGLRAVVVDTYDEFHAEPSVYGSTWVLLAREAAPLEHALVREAAGEPGREPTPRLWTDDYSNLLGVLKWGRGEGDDGLPE